MILCQFLSAKQNINNLQTSSSNFKVLIVDFTRILKYLKNLYLEIILLTDTERIYTEVMSRIGAKYGKKFTWEIKVKMMGMPSLKSAQKAVDEMELPITAEQFLDEAKIHKQELFPQCNILPGKSSIFRYPIVCL